MLLYHERQVAALCGVHTLNTLLQGPMFSEIDLAQIAQELDALERQFMQEGGMDSEEYQRFAAEGSGNVANDGMFSIQVLSKALQVWGVQVIPLDSPDMECAKAEPHKEDAFICNLQEHWFTIRKTEDGAWWNFNSLFPAPQPLSHFYLAAFLDSLKEQGYTIFVAHGQLPKPQYGVEGQGTWLTAEEAVARNQEAEATRQRGKVRNALETALARATNKDGSLQLNTAEQRQQVQGAPGFDGDDFGALAGDDADADLAAAIAASLASSLAQAQPAAGPGPSSSTGAAASAGAAAAAAAAAAGGGGAAATATADVAAAAASASGGSPQEPAGFAFVSDDDEDPELAAAIAASLQDVPAAKVARTGSLPEPLEPDTGSLAEDYVLGEEPAAGEGVLELCFRLPSGQRCTRRFSSSEPVKALYVFVAQQGLAGGPRLVICTQFPRLELSDREQVLGEVGLGSRALLNVEKKP